jgi:hypothetical protein
MRRRTGSDGLHSGAPHPGRLRPGIPRSAPLSRAGQRSGSRPGQSTSDPGADLLELVLVDGDNLLHRVRGMRDEAGLRWLLPRLRAWLPVGVRAVVMLDGHPDPGESRRRRVAPGIEFEYSGAVDADTALVGILGARPYAERSRTVLVTDDRALGDRARTVGGLVRRLDWLTNQLARAVEPGFSSGAPGLPARQAPPVGIGRRPGPVRAEPPPDDEHEPWQPGRGATRKRGNPRRGHPA